MKTILVFPAGTALGVETYASLHNSRHFSLIGVSSCIDNVTIYPKFEIIPSYASSDTLVQDLDPVIEKHGVDILMPTHDDALVTLKRHFGSKVAGSPLETIEICRSKTKTYHALMNYINTPEILNEPTTFPVFVKPDCGQGSRGARLVKTRAEFEACMNSEMIALEYLPGKEYTIDCFTDRYGALRYVNPRERVVITNGISATTRLEDDSRFYEFASIINSVLKFRGAWFFQLKENLNNDLSLLEVAPRIAGSSGINRINGVNLSMLTLWDYLDFEVELLPQKLVNETVRILATNFSLQDYNQLYVDLDDCLLVNGRLNPSVVAFALKERNQGKTVNLLTRCKTDPIEKLREHKLADFFDEIIWVTTEPKSQYMVANSLLLDDSFAERKDVQNKGHKAISPQAILVGNV